MKQFLKTKQSVFIIFILFFCCAVEGKVTPIKPKCRTCYSCLRGPQGPAGVDATGNNYVFAYDTTSQVIAMPNVFQVVNFDTSQHLDGWINESPSVFKCNQTGLYCVEYTVTAQSSIFDETVLSVIGYLDNNEIAGSQVSTSLTLLNHPISCTKKFLMHYQANQVFNLAVTASDPGITLIGGGHGLCSGFMFNYYFTSSLIEEKVNEDEKSYIFFNDI